MQLLELPLEVFRLIIATTVKELGLKHALRVRPVSRFFADEIWDAIFTTRVIEDIHESHYGSLKVRYRLDIIERYVEFRVLAVGSKSHPLITMVRDTAQALAQHLGCGDDLDKKIELQRHACACLAANAQQWVFKDLKDDPTLTSELHSPLGEHQDKIEQSSLTIAAWMGDLNLVQSLHNGSDPSTPFGRPSWAAATHGQTEVLQFLFDKGALPYEPTYMSGPDFALYRSALASAAYMGHEDVVKLILAQPYYASDPRPADGWREANLAAYYAAQGDQPSTLKILLEYVKDHELEQEYLTTLDWCLVRSSTTGSPRTVKVALDLGANIKETDQGARSCLQLAAKAGNAQVVKLLLDAGVAIEAGNLRWQRSTGRAELMRKQKDALFEARKRNFPEIVRLIEEKKKALATGT